MLANYIKLALRNLAKHRLYTLINIAGLSLGLCIFLFGSILVAYEKNHDNMFSKRDRIYIVGSIFSPDSGTGIREYPSARLTYGPLFKLEIEGIEQVARTVHRNPLLTAGNNHYYQPVKFVESGFTHMFDFTYLHGDANAIDNPNGLILTASTANKLFGRTDVLGEVVTLEHQHDFYIGAVIADVAADSHFNSSFLPDSDLTAIASLEALVTLENFDMKGQWKGLSPYDLTYLLMPENTDPNRLQSQVEAVSARHAPEDEKNYISALKVRPLVQVNTQIWDAFGFPVLESVQLLGLLILLIACLNYTNLATAQNFGRSREVGLRKTLGATRRQLLVQFLTESLSLAIVAAVFALAGIELLLPVCNGLTGKAVALDYASILPWLILTTIAVSLLAGAYPAILISRLTPIDSLRNTLGKGRKGNRFRSFMIAAQFSISIFMLAMVTIIYFQNEKIRAISGAFLDSPTVILKRVGAEEIRSKHETLRQELLALKGVQSVSFSNEIPYNSGGEYRKVTPIEGDETLGFDLNTVYIDHRFIDTYKLDMLAGRQLNLNIANDSFNSEVDQINVLVNELAAEKLGLVTEGQNLEQALGQTFYKISDDRNPQPRAYTIVGVIKDHYFDGAHSRISPMAFFIRPEQHDFASIKVNEKYLQQTLLEIDGVWEEVVGNYPLQRTFLDFYFNLFFRFPEGINNVLAAFSCVALSLALIGLFGLSAFMARVRTREIGIRKVLGASVNQIVRLLIWQFSRPVMWSLLVSTPLAYLASHTYLEFFPERIGFTIPVIALASLFAILISWVIVAAHAVKIANTKPVNSIRYE